MEKEFYVRSGLENFTNAKLKQIRLTPPPPHEDPADPSAEDPDSGDETELDSSLDDALPSAPDLEAEPKPAAEGDGAKQAAIPKLDEKENFFAHKENWRKKTAYERIQIMNERVAEYIAWRKAGNPRDIAQFQGVFPEIKDRFDFVHAVHQGNILAADRRIMLWHDQSPERMTTQQKLTLLAAMKDPDGDDAKLFKRWWDVQTPQMHATFLRGDGLHSALTGRWVGPEGKLVLRQQHRLEEAVKAGLYPNDPSVEERSLIFGIYGQEFRKAVEDVAESADDTAAHAAAKKFQQLLRGEEGSDFSLVHMLADLDRAAGVTKDKREGRVWAQLVAFMADPSTNPADVGAIYRSYAQALAVNDATLGVTKRHRLRRSEPKRRRSVRHLARRVEYEKARIARRAKLLADDANLANRPKELQEKVDADFPPFQPNGDPPKNFDKNWYDANRTQVIQSIWKAEGAAADAVPLPLMSGRVSPGKGSGWDDIQSIASEIESSDETLRQMQHYNHTAWLYEDNAQFTIHVADRNGHIATVTGGFDFARQDEGIVVNGHDLIDEDSDLDQATKDSICNWSDKMRHYFFLKHDLAEKLKAHEVTSDEAKRQLTEAHDAIPQSPDQTKALMERWGAENGTFDQYLQAHPEAYDALPRECNIPGVPSHPYDFRKDPIGAAEQRYEDLQKAKDDDILKMYYKLNGAGGEFDEFFSMLTGAAFAPLLAAAADSARNSMMNQTYMHLQAAGIDNPRDAVKQKLLADGVYSASHPLVNLIEGKMHQYVNLKILGNPSLRHRMTGEGVHVDPTKSSDADFSFDSFSGQAPDVSSLFDTTGHPVDPEQFGLVPADFDSLNAKEILSPQDASLASALFPGHVPEGMRLLAAMKKKAFDEAVRVGAPHPDKLKDGSMPKIVCIRLAQGVPGAATNPILLRAMMQPRIRSVALDLYKKPIPPDYAQGPVGVDPKVYGQARRVAAALFGADYEQGVGLLFAIGTEALEGKEVGAGDTGAEQLQAGVQKICEQLGLVAPNSEKTARAIIEKVGSGPVLAQGSHPGTPAERLIRCLMDGAPKPTEAQWNDPNVGKAWVNLAAKVYGDEQAQAVADAVHHALSKGISPKTIVGYMWAQAKQAHVAPNTFKGFVNDAKIAESKGGEAADEHKLIQLTTIDELAPGVFKPAFMPDVSHAHGLKQLLDWCNVCDSFGKFIPKSDGASHALGASATTPATADGLTASLASSPT
jgi:hypothetical protein